MGSAKAKTKKKAASGAGDLPNIGKPATRALQTIGVTKLTQVTKYTEAELLDLHGVGPKAIRILREALNAEGRSFRSSKAR